MKRKLNKVKIHLRNHRWVYLGVFAVFLIWFWFFSLPRPLFDTPTSTVLFSDDHQLLGGTIARDGQWRFAENDSVPKKFAVCVQQFEDTYFSYHPGVNPVAIARAISQNIQLGKVVSGGSTLTMQTIRLAKKNPKRTYWEKLIEMLQALRLELTYSKQSILLKYASHAPFGGNVVGLDAASWRYFGKLSHQLSWGESATLAVLPNAPALIYPGKNHEKLQQKRNALLFKLWRNKIITEEDYQLAILEDLPEKPNGLPQKSYHLLQSLNKKYPGERLHSTIDVNLQNQLNTIAFRHHQKLKAQEIHNLAVLVIEVESGDVKGYIGNSDGDNQHSNHVDIIQAPRSSGSILKPFLYEKMLQDGALLPQMLLNDTPSDITENYDKQYDGAVPADQALARSLNIPAIDMLKRYGVEKFYHQLKKVGFTTYKQTPDHYGLSLIVGGGEVNLWDLGQAYRNMVYHLNHPEEESFNQILRVSHRDKVGMKTQSPFQVQAAFLTLEALQKVVRPEAERGWHMFGRNTIAWKTGTSHGFKDAWAVGMTPEYVVAVWAGNADGDGRPGIIGVKAAAPILFDIFNRLRTEKKFNEPKMGWSVVKVCSQSGYKAAPNCPETKNIKVPKLGENQDACIYHQKIHLDELGLYRVSSDCYAVNQMQSKSWFVLPAIQEWYFRRKNPWYQKLPAYHPDCEQNNSLPFAIIYPKNFTRILLPVDMKSEKQKVVFSLAHRNPEQKVFWYLDGSYIATSQHTHQVALQPEQGKHWLVLSDENGNQLSKSFTIVE